MASAKKCDRCGVFYTENTRFPKKKGTYKATIDGACFTTTTNVYTDYFDLCDDCIAELKLFLNGKKLRED